MSEPITVYQFARSPFCIAIVQALRAGGVEPELVEVSSTDRSVIINLTQGAYYEVPVLQHGERVIFESGPETQDVAAYLDEQFLAGHLFPPATRGWQSIANRYLENEVESVTFKVCDAAFLPTLTDVVERTMIRRYKERKFGLGCVERWGRERESLIATAVRLLEPFVQTLAAGGPFLFGAAPVYTDFLLYGVLGNFTFREAAPYPAGLREWRARMEAFRY